MISYSQNPLICDNLSSIDWRNVNASITLVTAAFYSSPCSNHSTYYLDIYKDIVSIFHSHHIDICYKNSRNHQELSIYMHHRLDIVQPIKNNICILIKFEVTDIINTDASALSLICYCNINIYVNPVLQIEHVGSDYLEFNV